MDVAVGTETTSVPVSRAGDASSRRETLVVVGNGMVSFRLCETLAAVGASVRYEVVVLGEEPRPAYDRVHLTDVLVDRPSSELILANREWYTSHGIRLETGHKVDRIDRECRMVATDRGLSIRYDKLVLATGSRPFIPSVPGTDHAGVFAYRTLDDLAAIRRRARAAVSAAVVGGGLLGLEAARALHLLGIECHVLEQAPYPLCQQLDPTAGELALNDVRKLGIGVRVGVNIRHILKVDPRLRIEFSNREEPGLSVDLVVVAAGIRPRDELGRESGLSISGRGGIQINDRLQTSDPRIYAIGECASHRGQAYGLVAPGFRMAEVLAANLTGGNRRFTGADQSTRLKVLGLDVAALGEYNQPNTVVRWQSDGLCRSLVLREGRLVGATALGNWPGLHQVQDAVTRNARLWPWQVRRFRRTGHIRVGTQGDVTTWPMSATVCNCMNLSKGALAAACANGCSSIDALSRSTGAGSLCGSCKPILGNLLGVEVDKVSASRALSAVGATAFLVAAAVVLLPSIPYAESVRASVAYDIIWRNGTWRQATGYSMLLVSTLTVLLSLRKRWPRFSWGDYRTWRVVHGIVGVAGLALLVAHTGLRFGANLNLALMLAFVGANLVGTLAAVATGLEDRLAGRAGKLLTWWLTWNHVALVYPLPVLVGFHILSAYYF